MKRTLVFCLATLVAGAADMETVRAAGSARRPNVPFIAVDDLNACARRLRVVREMRHKGTSVLVASQDPPSLPVALMELSSQIVLHRFNSPAWLKHIQKANAALASLSPEQLARLPSGEAYLWSAKASDPAFTREAVRIQCRPRATLHGGGTRTAV